MNARLLLSAVLTGISILAGGASAQSGAPYTSKTDLDGYNLVLVVVDSLRADHLGAYGYGKATSPFIDSLADDALVFTRAMAASPVLGQSLSAILSGRLPTSGGAVGLAEAHPADETATLPQVFRRAGYYTGLVANQTGIKGKGLTKGFEEVQIATAAKPWDGESVTKRALDFVGDAADDKFMLYVQYAEPGQPRSLPEPPASQLAGGKALEQLIDRYDAKIAYVDKCIRGLVEGLRNGDKLDNTLVVITGSHGEEFLDHGYMGHGWTLYEEALRVPLILYAPKALPPGKIDTPVSLVNLFPTICAAYALENSPPDMDGEPLFYAEDGRLILDGPYKPQIAELVIKERCILRTVVQGTWKYIAAQRWIAPEDRVAVAAAFDAIAIGMSSGAVDTPPLWEAPRLEELYNLSEDPGEKNNRAPAAAAQLALMREALQTYRDYCEEFALSPREQQYMGEVLDPSDQQQLESLGYL